MLLPRTQIKKNKGVGLVHQSMDSNVGKKERKKLLTYFPTMLHLATNMIVFH